MSFAQYMLRAKAASAAAELVAKNQTVRNTVATAVKNQSSTTANGLANLGDDIVRMFSRPNTDDFVQQAVNNGQQVTRHAGDTFVHVPKTGGLTFSPRRSQVPQQTQQPSQQLGRNITSSADDALSIGNPIQNSADDFWGERMTKAVDEYVDDVYKGIDDELSSGIDDISKSFDDDLASYQDECHQNLVESITSTIEDIFDAFS